MRFTRQADIPPVEYVKDAARVAEVCEQLERTPGTIGFDTETSGLDQDGLDVDMYCVGLASAERRVVVPTWSDGSDFFGSGAENLTPLLRFLVDTQNRHAGYNWVYDSNVVYGYTKYRLGRQPVQLNSLYADGLRLFCHFDEEGEDTYGDRSLKDRCRYWLGLPMNDFDSVVRGRGFAQSMKESPDLTIDYAGRDAWGHLGLTLLGQRVTEQMPWGVRCPECGEVCYRQSPTDLRQWKCVDHGWVLGGQEVSIWDWHQEHDVPFQAVLQRMQVRGIPVDWTALSDAEAPARVAAENAARAFTAEINAAFEDMYGGGVRLPDDFNIRSDKQLARLYHEEFDSSGNRVGFGFPVYERTDTGGPSMKSDALRKLMVRQNAPGILYVLEHRKLSKILSTYIIGMQRARFDRTGRLHGSFRDTTTTGRLRSYNPNLQNLPTKPIHILLPPPAPYIPSPEEMKAEWGLTDDEAALELQSPEYQSREVSVSIRRSVLAPDGYVILCADYAQLEVRLTAMESGCSELIRVINENVDMHCYAAARAFASALNGAGYDELYEAKQADDGDMVPRYNTIASLTDPEKIRGMLEVRAPEVLRSMDGTLAEATELVLSPYEGLSTWVRRAHEETGDDPAALFLWLQARCPDVMEALLAILSYRDGSLLGLRKAAKACLFGMIYGIGPTKLAADVMEVTKQPYTVGEAKELITSVKDDVFPGIGRMIARQKAALRERGYVRTAMGRYRHPAGAFSGNAGKRAQADRQSSNSPIQGLAADVVQSVMRVLDVDEEFRSYGAKILLQVHDELVAECPEETQELALARMTYIMETAHRLDTPVPLLVSAHAGKTWDDAK